MRNGDDKSCGTTALFLECSNCILSECTHKSTSCTIISVYRIDIEKRTRQRKAGNQFAVHIA